MKPLTSFVYAVLAGAAIAIGGVVSKDIICRAELFDGGII